MRKQGTLRLEILLFSFSARSCVGSAPRLAGLLLIRTSVYHGDVELQKPKGAARAPLRFFWMVPTPG